MNIAILGVGNIGRTLGKKWASAGHAVVFGTRDVNSRKAQTMRATFPAAKIVNVPNALVGAELILLALPYSAVAGTIKENADTFAGKIVIDATNNFGSPTVNHLKTILDAAPTARVFRAFNSLGWEVFENPQFDGKAVDHFYCGPDDDTRPIVDQLIAEIGLRPVWVGGHEVIHIVDALGSLWVTLVFQRHYPRSIALNLMQRS